MTTIQAGTYGSTEDVAVAVQIRNLMQSADCMRLIAYKIATQVNTMFAWEPPASPADVNLLVDAAGFYAVIGLSQMAIFAGRNGLRNQLEHLAANNLSFEQAVDSFDARIGGWAEAARIFAWTTWATTQPRDAARLGRAIHQPLMLTNRQGDVDENQRKDNAQIVAAARAILEFLDAQI